MDLMMIIRNYDEDIQTSVGKILEDNFLHGIRSHSEAGNGTQAIDPVTDVPSTMSMFPQVGDIKAFQDDNKTFSWLKGQVHLLTENRVWTILNQNESKHLVSVQKKIFKKMNKLFRNGNMNNQSFADRGHEIVNDLCT